MIGAGTFRLAQPWPWLWTNATALLIRPSYVGRVPIFALSPTLLWHKSIFQRFGYCKKRLSNANWVEKVFISSTFYVAENWNRSGPWRAPHDMTSKIDDELRRRQGLLLPYTYCMCRCRKLSRRIWWLISGSSGKFSYCSARTSMNGVRENRNVEECILAYVLELLQTSWL